MYCVGQCYPPASAFPFWDLITGSAPVNDYSILGYQMLVTAYILALMMVPVVILIAYHVIQFVRQWMHGDFVHGKFDINGNEVVDMPDKERIVSSESEAHRLAGEWKKVGYKTEVRPILMGDSKNMVVFYVKGHTK